MQDGLQRCGRNEKWHRHRKTRVKDRLVNGDRTWSMTAWQGVLAALWVAAIAICAYVALSVRDYDMLLDSYHRAAIASDTIRDDQHLQIEGKSLAASAQVLIKRIESTPNYRAAVVNDAGRLVAGDKALLSGITFPDARYAQATQIFMQTQNPGLAAFGVGPRPQGLQPYMPPGFLNLLPPRAGQPVQLYPPAGFVVPPPDTEFAQFRTPFFPGQITSTIVRLNGGWLVFDRRPNALGNLGMWYWPASALLMLVSFVTVWTVGRRTLLQTARPMARVERGLRRLADPANLQVEAIASDDAGLAAPLIESYNVAALALADTLRKRAELEPRIRQFVADAGHELRTPLAVIMGYVQLLRHGSETENSMAARIYAEIEGQGQRIATLIQKLLLLTRLESQDPRDVKVLDVTEVARTIVDSFLPLAGESKLVVRGDRDALVKASESELHEIVGNLIDNAIKYAPGSMVETTVRSNDDSVTISVADDGPGMGPELRARAFERFSRGETAGSVTGSGLGLAIVETAVQRAGGSVSLRTALGQGTMVEIRLPAWREDER
jgi:signal transduction histidine kinase